ncbi:RNA polymerase sigma-70 factor [Sphingobacterium psychroaquaticum]|uniref:RNA polymerase sigma-70 factor, ECF subfamily n=1 Tax=Sphingobacterium psychroaquaticum TaxID=561061 RepID=A0A1X7JCV0_9SPHI|nr:RNA polymerase sigma-70 factor [Sphingobacterium psychroaquaticum]SMG25502.1 RNA polymerase sigma-70 factor, ECF subfamily [Sphingobacterium psychroaquaticum]
MDINADHTTHHITRESFEELFQTYWKRMYSFALKTADNADDAKEIVQEIFKSLWERKDKLSLHDAERYLLRSVKLKSLEYIRNKATRNRHHEVILTESNVIYEDSQLHFKELKDRINHVVNMLPKQCKNVFKMSREQGLTNREIAQLLFISERAVEYHISKALVILRAHFQPLK